MFTLVKTIDQPKTIKEMLPVTEELKAVKHERDLEITRIIMGESDKLLVLIGPCSADNETAVLDYVGRLAKVAEK